MSEDQTQPTLAIGLAGGLAMLIGFLTVGLLAVAIVAVVVVLWAGFALGPSRSFAALTCSLVAGALVYGVLALGDAVIDGSGPAGADSGAVTRARSEAREQRRRADKAEKRLDDAERDAAASRGRLRSSRREASRLRRQETVLRRALRRVARDR